MHSSATIHSQTLPAEGDPLASLRVGLVCSELHARRAGQLIVNTNLGRLIQCLRERLPCTRMCVNTVPEPEAFMDFALRCADDDVVDLPPMPTTMKAQKQYFRAARVLRDFERSVDLVYIRLPFQIPRAPLVLRKPKLLHVTGDPVEIIDASTDYRGAMGFLARRFARHSMAMMRRMAAEPRTRTMTHGQGLWQALRARQGRVVVSSAMYRAEMRPRTDHALGNPPRLLFVGFVRPEKGIEVLVDAFDLLRKERPLALTLAGGVDRASGATEALQRRLAASPYRADITMTGPVEFGEKVFDLYRTHDVFVLPSLSEGTPRTLVEARALGCPVIASRVGGIPTSVADGEDGLLVPPRDPQALAAAIRRVLDDSTLRKNLIDQGLRRSVDFSVEGFADQIAAELRILAAECCSVAKAEPPDASDRKKVRTIP
jgi:glycosyltransferase involved in cell wall biosynthesis